MDNEMLSGEENSLPLEGEVPRDRSAGADEVEDGGRENTSSVASRQLPLKGKPRNTSSVTALATRSKSFRAGEAPPSADAVQDTEPCPSEPVGAIHESPADMVQGPTRATARVAPTDNDRDAAPCPSEPVGVIHESPAVPCHPERSETEPKDLPGSNDRPGRSLADARDDAVGVGVPGPVPDLREHASRLLQEAQALRGLVPDFDLERELREDPRFARLTAPQFGLSLADAYFATHREEILAARDRESTRQALSAAASTLRAARSRPRENGGSSAIAERRSYSELSAAERAEFKSRLRRSWARGEKPGTEF